MRKSKFSEEQIINLLKSVEAGQKVADVCRAMASASRPITGGKSTTSGCTGSIEKKGLYCAESAGSVLRLQRERL